MSETLQHLITGRGFDAYRADLERRYRANGLRYLIHYGQPPSFSLLVRLESEERIGELCAWESGDCEVQLAAFKDEEKDIRSIHHRLNSGEELHARLAEVFRFVAKNETAHE